MSATARALSAAASVLALAAVAAGCGTPSPDLFVLTRGGTVPGARLTMLVSDQSVRCNGGPVHPLTSAQVVQVRELSKDLVKFQLSKAPIPATRPAQIFSFSVRNENGTLRYPDTIQRPAIFPRITLFVRQAAIDLCRLTR